MPQAGEDTREWWYCDQQGEKHGPVPFGTLLTLNEQGAIEKETLVWQAGTPAWRSLGEVLQGRVVACDHFSFVCRKQWTELTATASSDVRHCDDCSRQVHLCDSVAKLHEHSRSGHCVAWRMPDFEHIWVGTPAPPFRPSSRRWWQFWKRDQPEPRPTTTVADLESLRNLFREPPDAMDSR